jgi:hypothetical protein
MAMLGLKTLPVNHRLHRIYRILGVLVGLLLVALGIVGFLVSGNFLGIPTSAAFCGICLVAGAIYIAAAGQGRNAAAEANAYTGAVLILLGLVGMLTMHNAGSNFLDVTMADLVVWFVAGMTGLAAGFYGRVGPVPAH